MWSDDKVSAVRAASSADQNFACWAQFSRPACSHKPTSCSWGRTSGGVIHSLRTRAAQSTLSKTLCWMETESVLHKLSHPGCISDSPLQHRKSTASMPHLKEVRHSRLVLLRRRPCQFHVFFQVRHPVLVVVLHWALGHRTPRRHNLPAFATKPHKRCFTSLLPVQLELRRICLWPLLRDPAVSHPARTQTALANLHRDSLHLLGLW